MTDVHNVTSQADGAKKLQAAIITALGKISFPPGLGVGTKEITGGIQQNLDASSFDKHNQDPTLAIVEVHATFKATKGDGTDAFTLKIIWDADVPPTGSNQTAHFGWEIYLNSARVAGPGHIFFQDGLTLANYRRPNIAQVEEHSLRLNKKGTMGTGSMSDETCYFKLDRPGRTDD